MKNRIITVLKLSDKDYLAMDEMFPQISKEDLHNSLGFADKETGEAYIRQTGIKDVDDDTIQHEIQELLAETSPHEKNGIRFGWFRKAFGFSSQPAVNVAAPIAAAMIPGIGPVISGLLAAATSAATQKLNTGKINALQVGLSGLGGGLMKGAMMPGITAAKAAGSGIGGQLGSGLLGFTPTATQAGTSGLLGAGGHLLGMGAGNLAATGISAPGTVISKIPGAAASATLPGGGPVTSGLLGGSSGFSIQPNAATGIANLPSGSVPNSMSWSLPSAGVGAGIGASLANALTPQQAAYQQAATAASPYGAYGNPTNIAGANPTIANSQMPANLLGSTPGTGLGVNPNAKPNVASNNIPEEVTPTSKLLTTKNTGFNNALDLGDISGKAPAEINAAINAGKTSNLLTPQNILGAGSLAASALTPTPEAPNYGDITAPLRAAISSGGQLTEQGKQAKLELGNIMSAKPTELYPTANDEYYNAILRRTRESYAQAEKELDAAYNKAGVYGSGEHLAEKGKLKEQLARTESALSSEIEQRRFELATTAKYQAIQDSLNVDKSTMDDLLGLTGFDAQTIAQAYGAKVEDVQQMRQMLGTFGIESILRGKGQQTQQQ